MNWSSALAIAKWEKGGSVPKRATSASPPADGRYLVWGQTREVGFDDDASALLENLKTTIRFVREQNNWQAGDRVRLVFHVYKPLKHREIDAIRALVRDLVADEHPVEFAFLDISRHHDFFLFDLRQKDVEYYTPGIGRCRAKRPVLGMPGRVRRTGLRRSAQAGRTLRVMDRRSRALRGLPDLRRHRPLGCVRFGPVAGRGKPRSAKASRLRFGRHRVAFLPHHCSPQGWPRPPMPGPRKPHPRGRTPAQRRRNLPGRARGSRS